MKGIVNRVTGVMTRIENAEHGDGIVNEIGRKLGPKFTPTSMMIVEQSVMKVELRVSKYYELRAGVAPKRPLRQVESGLIQQFS